MEIESILEEIGLTKNEIIIYLVLIGIGSTKTGPIIKESGLHSSKVYDGLERLLDKGLVSYVVKANTKHFKAVDPHRLLDYLHQKKKNIEEQEKDIKKILPGLVSQQMEGLEETEAEIFKGWKGMETVFNMLRNNIGKSEVNYIFGASKGEDEERVATFFRRHVGLMIKKKIKSKIIYNESARGNIPFSYEHPELTQARHMVATTPAEINIWGENTMIVILRKTPTVILIKDRKVADSFRDYFELMWKIAKK